MVAALVCKFDAESFMRNFECTMHSNMPLSFGTRWLDEPTHIDNPLGPHNGAGPGGIGKFVLAKRPH